MKKVTRTNGEFIEGFKLYLEDLHHIVEIYAKFSDDLSIVVNGYKLDSFEELTDVKFKNIKELQLTMSNPYVSIDYKDNRIWLYTNSDDYTNLGIFNEIKSIIVRDKLYSKIRSSIEYLPFALVGGYIGYCISNNISIKTPTSIISLSVYIVIAILMSKKLNATNSVIYNYKSTEKSTFWSRNKDNIIISIGSLVLGSIFTLIIQRVLGQ